VNIVRSKILTDEPSKLEISQDGETDFALARDNSMFALNGS